jgi:outer membrane protein assembly factor BamD
VAASTAVENSRASYTLANRAQLLFLHKPDVVQAARIGAPTMVHPKPTLAPEVIATFRNDFDNALKGIAPAATVESSPASAASTPAAGDAPATAGGEAGGGTLSLHDVPTVGGAGNSGSSTGVMTSAPTSGRTTGTSVGLRIVTPTDSTPAPAATTPATPALATPSPLAPVGPANNKTLPPIEKAAAPPVQVDEIPAGSTPAVVNTTAPTSGKKAAKPKKAPVDSKNESSSKQKPKKGLGKLNPF